MKIINLTLLFLLGSLSLHAQDDIQVSSGVKVTKSAPYPVVDAYSKEYYSLSNGEVLSIKQKRKGGLTLILQKFSGESLDESQRGESVLSIEKGMAIEGTFKMGETFYLMYSKLTASKEVILYAREISTASLSLFGEEKELLTMTQPENQVPFGGIVLSKQTFPRFSFDFSSDQSVMVVRYRKKPVNKDDSNNHDVIGMCAFDRQMTKLWGNEFEMPYTESLMDNLDFTVDSKANGYFLIKKYKEELTRKNREVSDNESMAILVANQDGSLTEVEFNLGEKMLDDVSLKENKNGDIICAGYYRKPKSYGVEGAFVSILDSKGNLSAPKLYEFSLDFIKKYKRISDKAKKKMENADANDNLAMSNLRMRRIQTLEDGGIVLAGEIFYITTHTDSKGNTYTTYHYDDVIVVKINADGELGWMQKFPKRSISESFRLMASEKYTYVLFLDPVRNATMTDDGEVNKDIKGDCVTAHCVDNKTGEVKYLHLFDWRKIDGTVVYQYALNRVIPLTDNSFAIELYIKQKSDMMFKVEFEE